MRIGGSDFGRAGKVRRELQSRDRGVMPETIVGAEQRIHAESATTRFEVHFLQLGMTKVRRVREKANL